MKSPGLKVVLAVLFVSGAAAIGWKIQQRHVTGILFQDLAYVIIFSLLVSLSLVSMLASKLPRRNPERSRRGLVGRLVAACTAILEGLDEACGAPRLGPAPPGPHGSRRSGHPGREPPPPPAHRQRVPPSQRRGRGPRDRRDGGGHAARPGRHADASHGGTLVLIPAAYSLFHSDAAPDAMTSTIRVERPAEAMSVDDG